MYFFGLIFFYSRRAEKNVILDGMMKMIELLPVRYGRAERRKKNTTGATNITIIYYLLFDMIKI